MIQAGRENTRADETLALQNQQFDFTKANAARDWEMREDAADDAKDKDKLAMMLGVGNIGVQAYMGHKRNTAINSLLTPEVSTATARPVLSGSATNQIQSGALSPSGATSSAPGFFSKAGLSNVPGWKGAATSGSTYLGGLAGGVGSNVLYKGDNKLKKAAVGAGIGGATSWIASGGLQKLFSGGGFSGGDPYDTVLGTVLGGIFGGVT
jgi:hypothetical protein